MAIAERGPTIPPDQPGGVQRKGPGGPGPQAASRRQVHVLHIGKTGGSLLRQLLAQLNAAAGREVFAYQGHDRLLRDLWPQADYLFSVRDPIDRFRSAFYSRKRCGRPMYDSPWTADEALAFAAFAEANDLAEALAEDGAHGRAARAAVQSIGHMASHQVDWFAPQGFFLTRRPPVALFRQHRLAQDWTGFVKRLGLDPDRFAPEAEPVHANDYAGTPPLSPRARANLGAWYARDLAFVADCETFAASPPPPPGWLLDALAPARQT